MRTPTERAAQTMLAVRWPDGTISGMPGRKVIDMLAQALASAGVLATPEHDEQVRADERARVSVVHSTLTDEQLVDELVRRSVLDRHEHLTHQAGSAYLEVRYATRWALDTGTDEERGRERLSQLSRRLDEPLLKPAPKEPTDG